MNIALAFSGCHRRGGVERSVWEFAAHLSQRHQVTVYACEVDTKGLDKVNVVCLPEPSGSLTRLLQFRRSLHAALVGSSHDHVISFGIGGIGADVLWVNSVHRAWIEQSRPATGLLSAPWVPEPRQFKVSHQVLLRLERSYFASVERRHVVAVSEVVAQDLARLFGVPRHEIDIIPNGYSPHEFSPERCRALRSQARADFGYGADDVVLLMAANELARKGFGVLLEAHSQAGLSHLKILLAGRTQPGRTYLDSARRYGTADAIQFVGSHSDMGRLHAAADVFVLPTRYEAFCLAIVEALASGLPVITTDIPGAADRVTDGLNGRLLRDPRSSGELASALTESADPDVRSRWSAEAPATVKDLTWAALAAKSEALLVRLSEH